MRARAGSDSTRAGEPAADAARLRLLPHFCELSSEDLAALVQAIQPRTFERGQVILREGSLGEGFFIVLEGHVHGVKVSSNGREKVLLVMGPGDTFNNASVIVGGPSASTIIALEKTRIGTIPTMVFQSLLQSRPPVALAILRIVADRLRAFADIVADLSMLDVRGRLAKLLLISSQETMPSLSEPGSSVCLTQQELAHMVGTTRVVVAQCLREMREAGAVRQSRGRVHVVDPSRLRRLVQAGAK